MNNKRINELQQFKDDFNSQLQNASNTYEENNNEINNSKLLLTINDINDSTSKDFNQDKKIKIKKLKFVYSDYDLFLSLRNSNESYLINYLKYLVSFSCL